jgi:hypothetical protein
MIAGIEKEFRAAKEVRYPGKICYDSLFDPSSEIPWTMYAPITARWKDNARLFTERLIQLLTRDRGCLYPAYQRRKNMSRETAQGLFERGYRNGDKEWWDFSTGDLERHYAMTGEKILGHCEMRTAWTYNILKPRAYYCIGGTDYWASRYIKPIAIDFMNANPVTHTKRRMDPCQISVHLDPEDWIALWDLESFTTSLVELREFLFYTARFLESDPRCRQRPIQVFDSYQGVISMDIWTLLDDYNETVNQFSEFTMMRLIDKYMFDCENPEQCQASSGMLGVPGNIGLSTALHGLHVLPLVDRNKGVGVGDDEMCGIPEDPMRCLYPHVQQIGKLELSKTGTIPPQSETSSMTEKFVKRGITRTRDDLYLDKLFDFPLLAYGLDVQHPDRTVRFTAEEGLEKFLRQLGALYWDIHSNGHHVQETDLDLLSGVMSVVYSKWRIPREGRLPGWRTCGYVITACIPPIDDEFDPRKSDWAEVLWDRSLEMYAMLPVLGRNMPLEEYRQGEKFICSQTRLVALLEVIGVVEKVKSLREWVKVTETNRRRFRSSLQRDRGFFSLSEYRYCSFCPSWLQNFTIPSFDTVHLTTGVYGDPEGQLLNAINLF